MFMYVSEFCQAYFKNKDELIDDLHSKLLYAMYELYQVWELNEIEKSTRLVYEAFRV